MKKPEKNSQQNASQSEDRKTETQTVKNTQSVKLRRQKNGQYTGSLLG